MRALIFELHPTLLDTHGLVPAVREQAAWVTTRGGPSVTVDGPADRLHLAADAELDVYRLAQEALHNCVKHAAAGHVHVRVGPADDNPTTLLLEVIDDGCGFDPTGTAPGLGLVSMRERAERLGGQLSVTTRRWRRDRRPARRPAGPGRRDVTGVPDPPIRVLVVDDHEVVRLGLRRSSTRRPASSRWVRPPTGTTHSRSWKRWRRGTRCPTSC